MWADYLKGDHPGPRTRTAYHAAWWLDARSQAVPFLQGIAKDLEDPAKSHALKAADHFEMEVTEVLIPLRDQFPASNPASFYNPSRCQNAAFLLDRGVLAETKAIIELEPVAFSALGLADEESNVLSYARKGAIDAAGTTVLLRLMGHPKPVVRQIAASRLASAPKSPEVVAALAKALRDTDGPVGESALFSLSILKPGDFPAILALAWKEVPRRREHTDMPLQRQILFALRDTRGKEAIETLTAALEDEGEGDEVPDAIPKWAAEGLYEILGRESAPLFREGLESPLAITRRVSALYLGTLQDAESVAGLTKASKDLDPGVAMAAGRALVLCGKGDEGFAVLAGGMRNEDRAIRQEAVETLMQFGKEAVPAVVALTKDTDTRVRANSAIILARIGDASVIPTLEELAKDPEPKVRDFAAHAIADLKARIAAEKKDEKK